MYMKQQPEYFSVCGNFRPLQQHCNMPCDTGNVRVVQNILPGGSPVAKESRAMNASFMKRFSVLMPRRSFSAASADATPFQAVFFAAMNAGVVSARTVETRWKGPIQDDHFVASGEPA
jgi:hypothetical protein